jgi:hypothetical protein
MSHPITEANLLAAGYKKYPRPAAARERYVCMYEKHIFDEKGSKYCIKVYLYEHAGYSFCVQFEKANGEHVNVEHLEDCSIEEQEAFFEEIWSNVPSISYQDAYLKEENR